MKQKIMEKLFDEKPLTNEEILYIGANLNESSEDKVPYKHNESSVASACGLKKKDFDDINSLIVSEISNKNLKTTSEKIEAMEKIAMVKPLNMRLIIYNYIKLKENPAKSFSVGGGSLSGQSFKDFLDFLRKQGGLDEE